MLRCALLQSSFVLDHAPLMAQGKKLLKAVITAEMATLNLILDFCYFFEATLWFECYSSTFAVRVALALQGTKGICLERKRDFCEIPEYKLPHPEFYFVQCDSYSNTFSFLQLIPISLFF